MFKILKRSISDFLEDECMVSGASLAYYTIFSLPPLLVMLFYLAGLFGVSDQRIDSILRRQIGLPISPTAQAAAPAGEGQSSESSGEQSGQSGAALDNVVERRASSSTQSFSALGPASKVIGILLLVFSATGVFAQLQAALNRAWEVQPDPEQGGIWKFLFKRVLSLGMVVVIAFLLLVSLVLTTLVEEIVHLIQGSAPGRAVTVLGFVLNNLVAVAMATLLFAAVFRILPDAKIQWRDTWVGALATAVLFVIGKTAIAWYLQNSDVGSSWGSAASSMIAMLVWVYYTSLIVLYGAELTQAYSNVYGRGVQPAEGAVRAVTETRHVRAGNSSGAPTT